METFTLLFTDIEGSTALVPRLGEGLYTQLLADHHSLIRSGLAAHGGKEVDTQGDSLLREPGVNADGADQVGLVLLTV